VGVTSGPSGPTLHVKLCPSEQIRQTLVAEFNSETQRAGETVWRVRGRGAPSIIEYGLAPERFETSEGAHELKDTQLYMWELRTDLAITAVSFRPADLEVGSVITGTGDRVSSEDFQEREPRCPGSS
jgi:hypothetical protein